MNAGSTLKMVVLRRPGAVVQLLAAAAATATAPCPDTGCVEVLVDFSAAPVVVASTSSTVEVDVMPFLGRTAEGGPFTGYFEALSNLGSDFVRFAPWCTRCACLAPTFNASALLRACCR